MMKVAIVLLGLSVALTQAQFRHSQQQQQSTTPTPILRQINKVNEDGSYTYGYESGDGSYKVETKAQNGEVKGKYGYYDDAGTLREVEYGASKSGFHPTGTGINAPVVPTGNHVTRADGTEEDGTYDANFYERPYDHLNVNYDPAQNHAVRQNRKNNARNLNLSQQFQSQPQQQQQQQQQYQQPQPQYQPQQQYQPEPQYQPQRQRAQPQATYRNTNLPGNTFHGHPARNIDINSGSYSVQY